jgi:hypothetical protein
MALSTQGTTRQLGQEIVTAYLGYYGPTLMAMARALRLMPVALRKHASRGSDYPALVKEVGGEAGIHDTAVNQFIRAALEERYRSVVEIGAFDGRRIITLKRLCPDVAAYGLDILPNYAAGFDHSGVHFRKFGMDFFETVSTPALLCSRGTLPYLPDKDVQQLFSICARRGLDVALYEPVAYRNLPYSMPRSHNSWYHPYDHMLRQAGLTPEASFDHATGFSFSLSMMEAWYVNVAKAPRAL